MKFPHRVDIIKESYDRDTQEETEEIKLSNYRCWIQDDNTSEQYMQGRRGTEVEAVAYGRPNSKIQNEDKVRCKTPPYDGIEFRIRGMPQPTGLGQIYELELTYLD